MDTVDHSITGTQARMQHDMRLIWLVPVWLAFNVLQAAGMELDPDEAYYWLYSRQLDWGYFDHPPAIAALIKAGFALFPQELGVRLGAILLQSAGFILIWDLLGRPRSRSEVITLALLLAGLPMMQVYGFIATPDSPFLFFATLFFYAYQRFLRSDCWVNVGLLGAVMALMLYSKYHGVLVILFTLFSNLRLFLQPRFYLASIFGASLFFPHLYWQYDHGFPSFTYHLVGRDDAYELKHTMNYLLNQVFILSPLLFPLFVQVLYRRRPQDELERAFYFVIYGFWIFFFLSTFKGHAEPQWTAVVSIPLAVLAYRHARDYLFFAVWLRRLSMVTVVLLIAARIFLLLDTPWKPVIFRDQDWIMALQERAGGKAVVFENSYRDAAKYTFYTGERAYTFTDVRYRKNQFDIWDWETGLQGKSALFAGKQDWDCIECDTFRLANRFFKLMDVPSLEVAQKLRWEWSGDMLQHLTSGQNYRFEVRLANPYPHAVVFDRGQLPVLPVVYWLDNGVYIGSLPLQLPVEDIPAESATRQTVRLFIPPRVNWAPGNYQMGVGIQLDSLPPVVNGPLINITWH